MDGIYDQPGTDNDRPVRTQDVRPDDVQSPLFRDRSFWGMTATQFLGAFNDNLFKQLMLLLAIPVGAAAATKADEQGLATMVFSLPFVLFSGFAGYLSDRYSKRTMIVACKGAEIGIMLLGMLAFLTYETLGYRGLLMVLFLMGTHSAFSAQENTAFCPSCFAKQICRAQRRHFDDDVSGNHFWHRLGRLSGRLAVRRRWSARAGAAVDRFADLHWNRNLRNNHIAECPPRSGGRPGPEASAVKPDRSARYAGPAGSRSSPLSGAARLLRVLAFLGLGDAIGQFARYDTARRGRAENQPANRRDRPGNRRRRGAGRPPQPRQSRLSTGQVGGWGMVIGMLVMAISVPAPDGGFRHLAGYVGSFPLLVLLGMAAGMFAIPVQVFLQSRPPEDQKGRMIAVMNLTNFIAILLSGAIYLGLDRAITAVGWPRSVLFAFNALLILPVAIFYRPKLDIE